MIISDLNYLEVVSQASSIIGGETAALSAEASITAKKGTKGPLAVQTNATTTTTSLPKGTNTKKVDQLVAAEIKSIIQAF